MGDSSVGCKAPCSSRLPGRLLANSLLSLHRRMVAMDGPTGDPPYHGVSHDDVVVEEIWEYSQITSMRGHSPCTMERASLGA